jgi:small subunit ribosomal protein S1
MATETMTPESTVKGVVTKITAFGAFVELENGLEGLIHVTELSDQPFGKVEEVISVGQKVNAKVTKVDPENKKISLSIKECLIEQNKENRDEILVGEKKKRKTPAKKPKAKVESSESGESK